MGGWGGENNKRKGGGVGQAKFFFSKLKGDFFSLKRSSIKFLAFFFFFLPRGDSSFFAKNSGAL